ncbi:hypothetical protein H4S06_006500 [Coemansia sp. BCRC 34490]|nr:hypothetical protein H4S06_006500 [Coemansia sp. BCRC 34490]
MAATYGVYFLASFIYFEPWHMFTSFLQYTLWLPSSINILMVYAFCNTHDVSWGTKGDTAVASGMGHAKVEKKNGVDIAHVVVASDSDDINLDYDTFIEKLKTKDENKQEAPRDAQTKREDQNKTFRTAFVVSWMCSNAVLAMVISSSWFADATTKNDDTGSHNIYLSFILWSVAALSAFRFLGSMIYRIRFLFHD